MEQLQQVEISFHSILAATDFSPAAEAALRYAAAVADRYQAKLYAAHVINTESFDLLETESAQILLKKTHDEAERKLNQLLEPFHLGRDRCQVVVAEGTVCEVLMDIIQRHQIDLAVVGTHGRRGFRKLSMGSIAEELFRTAPCPVLTVGPNTERAPDKGGLQHVLYPLEFAPDLSRAANYAVALAERYSANLTVMNVREDMAAWGNATEEFAQPRKHWIEDHVAADSSLRNRLRFEMGFGAAADAILDFAAKEHVDLIVMSVRQLDPFIAAHLPKSDTAHALVSRAPCPVLTIR